MSLIRFFIEGQPVAKGRPRFYRRGPYVGTYTPDKTRAWETIVKGQAIQHRPKYLWEGPIIMHLDFMMPRPKSLPKKVVYHIKKPDADNLAKAIKDSLQGVIFKSDSQVVALEIKKQYAVGKCGVAVWLEEI